MENAESVKILQYVEPGYLADGHSDKGYSTVFMVMATRNGMINPAGVYENERMAVAKGISMLDLAAREGILDECSVSIFTCNLFTPLEGDLEMAEIILAGVSAEYLDGKLEDGD